ncbi:MAG TPA: membrane integrity-associated transporter subunit PqiC [Epsilonproteobacteria bacterium]|nr:membrane integrity-associated transporter subunit PqiC [Campylobacterota bacterium]
MLRKKILLPLTMTMLLSGCLSSTYYVLSTTSQPKQTYNYSKLVIGVEKVTVPEYLFKREIAVADSSSKIRFISHASWAEDLDAGLTQRLIGFLQKKFNAPNVYAYPWGVDKQPNKKVKVQISRFIAQDNHVYLDANWQVENMKTGKVKAKLFSTIVSTSGDANDIVASMDKAFAQLEETVANGIK